MERKTQKYVQNIKMPHLFREDLENIEKIIKEELNPQQYMLETKQFKYKEMSEISEDVDRVNEFHIQTYSPYISIDFNKYSARIYTNDDNIKTMGALAKISNVLSKRERKFLLWFSKLSPLFTPFLFLLPLNLFLWLPKETFGLTKIWFPAFLSSFFAVVWGISGYYISQYSFSLIEFVYKKTKSNFFTRNKDQIIRDIIVAIITILLTLLFQLVF